MITVTPDFRYERNWTVVFRPSDKCIHITTHFSSAKVCLLVTKPPVIAEDTHTITHTHTAPLYSLLGTAITKYQKLGGFKQQQCILSQFWRLEFQHQGVDRTMLPLKALAENLSCACSLALGVAGSPWHSLACSCIVQPPQ